MVTLSNKGCVELIPRILLAPLLLFCLGSAEPSFDCAQIGDSSIEKLICSDDELARLDRQLAETYAAARKSPAGIKDKLLKASQIGWIKGRNDCWKAEDRRQCGLR